MKRLTSLFALTLALLVFTACKNQGAEPSQMYIEKAQLSDKESKLVTLLNIDRTNNIYDFVVDDTVKSLEITVYRLADGKWNVHSQDRYAVSEPKGRIGFFYNKLYGETRISLQNLQGTTSSATRSLENFEGIDPLGYAGTTLSNRHSIALQEEIPIAVQIFSSSDTISCILPDSIKELMDYYINTDEGHEAVFAATIKFSTEPLS